MCVIHWPISSLGAMNREEGWCCLPGGDRMQGLGAFLPEVTRMAHVFKGTVLAMTDHLLPRK